MYKIPLQFPLLATAAHPSTCQPRFHLMYLFNYLIWESLWYLSNWMFRFSLWNKRDFVDPWITTCLEWKHWQWGTFSLLARFGLFCRFQTGLFVNNFSFSWLFVIFPMVTSEDVCWSIRNVKFINQCFYNMRCLVMFVTVCFLFLGKTIFWPNLKDTTVLDKE